MTSGAVETTGTYPVATRRELRRQRRQRRVLAAVAAGILLALLVLAAVVVGRQHHPAPAPASPGTIELHVAAVAA